ncbi:hypothetical protein ACFSW8_06160 [Rubritalea tangerina]|uniref:Lipoprotein n=2 Tax=Rubritalea tangerina TaxID=430798 RepID=A0ABW4Z908_9BACT
MQKFVRVGVMVLGSMLFFSCSGKKSTPELADMMTAELEGLPGVIRSVEEKSDAERASKEIRAMSQAIGVLIPEVPEGEKLTLEQRVIVEKKIRAVQDEVAYLLQRLSDRPEVLIQLSEPLQELGNVLEAASAAMK